MATATYLLTFSATDYHSKFMNFTAQNPFLYQHPSMPFDWRLFASTDVEGAIATQNVATLLPLVDSLAFGELDAPVGLQRVFRAQQFMVQYLIYVQTELTAQLANQAPNDTEALKREIQRLQKELALERQKRQSDNMMLRLASLKPELIEAMPRCLECGKAFADYRFLVQHYQRRHPGKEIPPPPLPNYKIERPEYKLCNCKIEQPVPLPMPQKQPSKNTSDIFMDNQDMVCQIQSKTVHDSLNQTDDTKNAQSPGMVQQYSSLDTMNAYKPQEANFSLASTMGKSVGRITMPPSQPQNIQKQVSQYQSGQSKQVVFDPDATFNSFTSEDGKCHIQSAYHHDKQQLNAVYEQLKQQIGLV